MVVIQHTHSREQHWCERAQVGKGLWRGVFWFAHLLGAAYMSGNDAHWAREVGGLAVDPDRRPTRHIVESASAVSGRMDNNRGTQMRILLTGFLVVLGSMAQAHVGHLADAAGHDHWAAGAALGIAIAIGLAGKLRERAKARDDEAVDVEDESEEVPA